MYYGTLQLMGLEQFVNEGPDVCIICLDSVSSKLLIVGKKRRLNIIEGFIEKSRASQKRRALLIWIPFSDCYPSRAKTTLQNITSEYDTRIQVKNDISAVNSFTCDLRENIRNLIRNLRIYCFFLSPNSVLNVWDEKFIHHYNSKTLTAMISTSIHPDTLVNGQSEPDPSGCQQKSTHSQVIHGLACHTTDRHINALSPMLSQLRIRNKDTLSPTPKKPDPHDVKEKVPRDQDKKLVQTPSSLMFAVLGWSGNSPTVTIEVYDPLARKWFYLAQKAFLKRAYHGVVMAGILIYVIGGFDGRRCYNTTYCFNLHKRYWYRRPNMWSNRCYVTAIGCRGMVYAVGGFDGDERFRSCERFDPKTRRWRFTANMNDRRSDASGTAHRGKIFVCGGFNGVQVLSSTEMYDPDCDQWTLISNMLSPRSGHCLISHQEALIALGGFDGIDRLRTVEEYNEDDDCWVEHVPMFSCRSNFAAAVVKDQLHVIGGYNGEITFPEVERFDDTQRAWIRVQSLNKHRSAFGACVFKDSMMVSMCSSSGYAVVQAVNLEQPSP